jgi:hypothetical protein
MARRMRANDDDRLRNRRHEPSHHVPDPLDRFGDFIKPPAANIRDDHRRMRRKAGENNRMFHHPPPFRCAKVQVEKFKGE